MRANGGAPALVVIGVGFLVLLPPLGAVLITLGILWFIVWLDPVRDRLIAFLEYPDEWADEPESTSGVVHGKTHIHAEAGSTVNVHVHPEGRRKSRRKRRKP